MNILDYLIPENEMALAIVRILWIICLLWAFKITISWFKLRQHKHRILRCGNIDGLAGELVQLLSLKNVDKEEKKKKGRKKEKNIDEEEERVALMQLASNAFSSFCREKNIREGNIVARHLRAIFDAGIQDSRLDVGELIKNTNNELFRPNSFLKSLMASFIVLGLLGTLIGLADSLASLSPVLSKGVVERTSAELTTGLSELFIHLKTAFAPSIWGVLFTVFGVILFSFYLHRACYPVKDILEKLTLTVWVPRLFLTQSQRYLGTLKLGEEQIQKNMEAINNLAEMHKTIRPDVEELSEKLKTSNQTLGLMNDSAREIQNFTSSFVDGVTSLSAFQTQLQSLYQKMIDESSAFQHQVQNSIENSRQFQANANAVFEHQNQQLEDSYRHLKSYEEAYVEHRRQIDAKLQELLDTAKKAYNSLSERNKDVLDIIGKPLTEKLTDIQTSLQFELNSISKRFDTFDVPIKAAAESISTTYINFERRTQTLTNEIRTEFDSQQEKINQGLQEFFQRMENITATIQAVSSQQYKDTATMFQTLADKFSEFDTRWQETRRAQVEQSKALEKNLSELSGSIKELPGAIGKIEKLYRQRDDTMDKLSSLGGFTNQLKQLIQQMRDDAQAEGKYKLAIDRNSNQMVEAIRALAISISNMTGKEVVVSNLLPAGNPGRERKPYFDFSHSPIINFFRRLFGKKY
jgi:biopolymer transport protein ExbB/TolQ